MKNIFLISAWWILTVSTIVLSSLSIVYVMSSRSRAMLFTTTPESTLATSNQAYGTSLGQVKGVETTVEVEDARAELVASFLERHGSPLTPYEEYGRKIVAIADKYQIDFRLLPAIAMQESNLCKKIPEGSYNCLGFGIHSRGTLGFESYEANFDRAARELKKNYIDKGLTTPAEIMTKYTPHSNGSWQESVNQWMAEMRYNDRTKGKELKTDADVLEFVENSPVPTPAP